MKKSWIIVLSLVSASSAWALPTPRTGAYVCNRISSAEKTVQCFAAIQDAYIDEYAAGACDRIQSAETTVSCMAAIANRQYTHEEIEACDLINNATQTVSCLIYAGIYAGGSCNTRYYTGQIYEALRYIRSGNTSTAEQILDRVARDLDR